MLHHRVARAALTLACLAIAFLLSACDRTSARFVNEGRTYTSASVLKAADEADAGEFAEQPTEDAAGIRHTVLVDLRKQGGDAARAAELLTETFPADTDAVPFYVERANFDSTPAWVVFEAIGRPGGTLEDTRVWVFDDSGAILLAGMR